MSYVTSLNEIYYNDVNQQPPTGTRYPSIDRLVKSELYDTVASGARDEQAIDKELHKIISIAKEMPTQEMMIHFIHMIKAGNITARDVNEMYNDLDEIKKLERKKPQ
jgi:hypothetical protein